MCVGVVTDHSPDGLRSDCTFSRLGPLIHTFETKVFPFPQYAFIFVSYTSVHTCLSMVIKVQASWLARSS